MQRDGRAASPTYFGLLVITLPFFGSLKIDFVAYACSSVADGRLRTRLITGRFWPRFEKFKVEFVISRPIMRKGVITKTTVVMPLELVYDVFSVICNRSGRC